MQAWLLHIIYGAFMGSASQYKEAKKMLRTGVDVRLSSIHPQFVSYSGDGLDNMTDTV